jgi:nitrite reductase (NADH) small subunit
MACQILIGSVDQIPKGEARIFKVDGRDIAVYLTHSGEVFASQPDCPHRGGPLADGLIALSSLPTVHKRSPLRTCEPPAPPI